MYVFGYINNKNIGNLEIKEKLIERFNFLHKMILGYLDDYFQTLKNGKASFEIKRKPVFRELPLKRFPFVIIYEEFRNQIIVYSVFNTFQNPSKKNK